jgi:hypothetical protein
MPESEEEFLKRSKREYGATDPPESPTEGDELPGESPTAGDAQTTASTGLGAGLEGEGGSPGLEAVRTELVVIRSLIERLPADIRNAFFED